MNRRINLEKEKERQITILYKLSDDFQKEINSKQMLMDNIVMNKEKCKNRNKNSFKKNR